MNGVRTMNNFIPTYHMIPQHDGGMYGNYHHGKSYRCLKDDSLKDTQILLVDEEGQCFWEHCKNFECDYTPYLVYLDVEYELDLLGNNRQYTFIEVWYREISTELLKEKLLKQLASRVKHQVKIIKVYS